MIVFIRVWFVRVQERFLMHSFFLCCTKLEMQSQPLMVMPVQLEFQQFLEPFLHLKVGRLQRRDLDPMTCHLQLKGSGSLLAGSSA